MVKRKIFPIVIIFIVAAMSLIFCEGRKKTGKTIKLPFPDDETALYYQSRVDSLEYDWYLDSKSAASAFANEFRMLKEGVSSTDIILIGEGIFHATVEIELPDKILVLELERPFKHLGRKSIWQVVEMTEKEWPKE